MDLYPRGNAEMFLFLSSIYIFVSCFSAPALFVEGIVLPVCDNDVVEKVDIHHFASTIKTSRQYLIGLAGGEIA